jgi:yeast amino acid transporter
MAHSFYCLSLLIVGLLVEHTNPRLLGSDAVGPSSNASPFVIAAQEAGLHGFDSFINAVIIIGVLSIANSGVYGASRTLAALASQGYAPKAFGYIDRAGRPLYATVAVISFGGLGYLNCAANGAVILEWLLALAGLASYFVWGSICVSHIRFRRAWKYHGRTLDEIPFRARFGEAGSWVSLIVIVLALVAQFYVALFPVNGGPPSAAAFFKAYLAVPVILLNWAGGFLWKKKGWLSIRDIDIMTGMREIDWEALANLKRKRAMEPWWMRVFHFLF